MRGLAAARPAVRALHGGAGIALIARVGGAFVKRHGDIRAERLLDLHHALRGEKVLAPIQKGTKLHAVLADLVAPREAEYLETAAVGQDRFIPPHEGMEAACLAHEPVAGALEQVIGVRKADLRTDLRKVPREHGLDGRLCANGHITRRFDDAVRCVQPPEPCAGLLAFMDQLIFEILHGVSFRSLDEHRVAEREEAVAFLYGMLIGGKHLLARRKGAYKHQKR